MSKTRTFPWLIIQYHPIRMISLIKLNLLFGMDVLTGISRPKLSHFSQSFVPDILHLAQRMSLAPEDKPASTFGSGSKWKNIPNKPQRAKCIFPHCTMFILDSAEVLELSAILIRQGLKFNVSDRSNQCCSQWDNIGEVSSQNIC